MTTPTRFGGLWQNGQSTLPKATQNILFEQLQQRGLPELDLPKLRLFSPLTIRSALFGPSDVPILIVADRALPFQASLEPAQLEGTGLTVDGDITMPVAEYLQ